MTLVSQEEYWQKHRSKYTLEQIGDMPQWINIQKNKESLQVNQKTKRIDIQLFNDDKEWLMKWSEITFHSNNRIQIIINS